LYFDLDEWRDALRSKEMLKTSERAAWTIVHAARMVRADWRDL